MGTNIMTDLLPKDLEAERWILAAMLMDPETLNVGRPLVTPEEFFDPRHRQTCQAIFDIYDRGEIVNTAIVARELQARRQIGAGGIAYLIDLENGMPLLVPETFATYLKIVKDKAARRWLITYLDNLEKRALRPDEPLDKLLQEVPAAGNIANVGTGPVSVRQVIDRVGINALLSPRHERGIRLPWPTLDEVTSGLAPKQLWVVAAGTGGGKTSFALQIAAHASVHGHLVLFFSLEMSAEELTTRMFSQLSGVRDLANPVFRSEVTTAVTHASALPFLFDQESYSWPAMSASIRRLSCRQKPGLVVVDYLQLLKGVGRFESRTKEVGANSRALKLLAMEFDIPVIMLSQLNRESAKDGRAPELHDLKESGDIENDADKVLFIHPTSSIEEDLIDVDVIAAKQRRGPSRRAIPMVFDTRCQRFVLRLKQ